MRAYRWDEYFTQVMQNQIVIMRALAQLVPADLLEPLADECAATRKMLDEQDVS